MSKGKRAIVAIVMMLLFAVMCMVIFVSGGSGGLSSTSNLQISEVMTSNRDTIPDAEGNYYDWVEIHNTTDTEIDMTGCALSDDPLSVGKFVFPTGTKIPANGYLIVYCSGAEGMGLHAPFRIADDETLLLLDATGRIIESIDLFGVLKGNTISRAEDNTWFEFYPTPGYPNTEEGLSAYRDTVFSTGEADGLYINEFMAVNGITASDCDGEYSDWIELYNSTDTDINLTGYFLSDSKDEIRKYAFASGTVIPAKSYLLVFCSGKAIDSSIELHAPFKLNSFSESVVLSAPNGSVVDSLDYGSQETDISMARLPDGTGEFMLCDYPSPGYPNTEEGAMLASERYAIKTGTLYISEMMGANYSYARLGDSFTDWLEIYNGGSEAVNLNGYGLGTDPKEIRWVFPDVTIAPGEYLIVYCTGEPIADDTGAIQATFKLSADGETVYLFDQDARLIDILQAERFYADRSIGRGVDGQVAHYIKPTPGAANGDGMAMTQAPTISLSAGSYQGAQTVSVSVPEGSTVYYTLDGSVPTAGSRVYTEPINITETTVLRVAAVASGCLQSNTVSASYIIDDPHELPVISIIADPDEHEYIYTNYEEEVEIEMHMDYFKGESLEYAEDGIIRIFGAFSRKAEQKGYALIARAGITAGSTFEYPFFDSREFVEYGSLILRASGQEYNMSRIRDIVVTSLVGDHTDLVVQAYQQCVVYVNGEYRGVYNLREKVNRSFLMQHYPEADKDSMDLLVGSGNRPYYILEGDNQEYLDMVDFAWDNDMTAPENYEYICSLMDVDNFATYTAMQIYSGNTDTGNIKFWRTEGRKWQWITYDFCWALNNRVGDTPGYKYNSVKRYIGGSGHGVNSGFSNRLIRALLTNPEFKQLFLEKCAYMADVVFSEENLSARIDECAARIRSEMPRDTQLWSSMSYEGWERHIEHLHTFASNRKPYFVYHIRDHFGLTADECMEIFGIDGSNPDA